MNRQEFETTKVGDKVMIGGHSKFTGQIASIISVQHDMPSGRGMTIHNELIGDRSYHFKAVKLVNEKGEVNVVQKRSPLVIFRYKVYIDDHDMMSPNVIANNKYDAWGIVNEHMLKLFRDDQFTVIFKDVVPIVNGAII